MKFECDTCGRLGSEDDGISGVMDDCPDEACNGTIHFSRDGYLEVLSDAREVIQGTLDTAKYPERTPLDLSTDEMHVILDALGEHLDQIDRAEINPWRDYR